MDTESEFRKVCKAAVKKWGLDAQLLQTQEEAVERMQKNTILMATVCNQAEADEKIPQLLNIPGDWKYGVSIEPCLGPIDLRHLREYNTDLLPWVDALTGSITKGHLATKPNQCSLDVVTTFQKRLDWVICGGETGPGARPMHPDWVRSLRDQCQAAGTPFFFKSWGEWAPRSNHPLVGYGVSASSLDPDCTRWECIRLTEQGNNGNLLVHSGEGEEIYMQRVGKRHAGRLLDGREWNEVPEVRNERI